MPSSIALPAALGHEPTDRRIAVLREIGTCGSISQAARTVGVSYKAAWQAIDTLSNLAGAPLVARAVGGAGGGGAALTAAGRELLAAADAMAQARGEVLLRWQAAPHAGPALARLAVRTSMRNQWPGVVERVERLGQIVRVHLVLGDPAMPSAPGLFSRITRESAELLGLRRGLSVQALCKATAVRVERAANASAASADPAGGQASAGCSRLLAKAVRVRRGASGDEVSAELPGGLQMVGFAASGSGLRSGHRIALILEENAVVLALAHA